MTTIDQKDCCLRQATLCYEIAASGTGERAASMVRLGDTYSTLAEDPDAVEPLAIYIERQCEKCGKKVRFTHSLPRTEIMPAMQACRCDSCHETLIWKSDIPSSPRRVSE
jgi:hypothetical protein